MLISLIISIFISLPVAIIKKLLSGITVLKLLGLVFYIGILLVSIFLTLTNAALMGIEASNNWAFAYISTNILDIFFF